VGKHHRAARQRFKATGPRERGLPLLIPRSFIERKNRTWRDFHPKLAVVTHGGGEELEEPLVIRPTSETIIGHSLCEMDSVL